MRVGFVTCVELGLSCMHAIYDAGGRIDLAITLQDHRAVNKAGRVWIDDFCASRAIPVSKCRSINDSDTVANIRAERLDILFIIGWSQIARRPLLDAVPMVLGMHPTLLPQGRGRAAIPWAILKRLDRTGVSLFALDEGVDSGPILDQIEIPLTERTDAASLYEKVAAAHADLMRRSFPKIVRGEIVPREQDESLATEWVGRTASDGEIDLTGSVMDAECLIRAVTRPYPGAFIWRDGVKRIIWRAETGSGGQVPEGAMLLNFRDGNLICTEWEDITTAAD